MKKMIGVAAICAVALTGLAACGGEEEAATAADASSAKADKGSMPAEWVAALDAICEEYNARARDVNDEAVRIKNRDGSDLAMAHLREHYLPLLEEGRAKVETLEVPPSERDFNDRYMKFNERLDALVLSYLDAYERDGYGDDTLNDEISRVQAQRNAPVDGHGGFESCGENSETTD